VRTALSLTSALTLVLLAACSEGPPTAEKVCKAMVEEKIAANCAKETPHGLGAKARDHWSFDIVGRPGKKGQIMFYENKKDYDDGFDAIKIQHISNARIDSTEKMYIIDFDAPTTAPEVPKTRVLLDKKGWK
jgi:hypothetical protein